MIALLAILAICLSFFVTAGLVWLLCWALPAIGIVAIGSFTIVFSWKLALIVWVILGLLRSIFGYGGVARND